MARDFANTAGSPNIDYITYSGVPPVAGLATCSIVVRIAGDSDCVSYGAFLNITDNPATNQNAVGLGRELTNNVMYCAFRNANGSLRTFPFTFDGTMRSVIVTFDGSASPKDVAYVNGVSQTLSGTLSNTTIGTGQTSHVISSISGYRWNGRACDLGIYNRVITPAEALIHAAGYSCRNFPRGLIFYAPMIREVNDIVGGLTGTITGTTVSDHPRIYA